MANYCGYTKEEWRAMTRAEQEQAIELEMETQEKIMQDKWQDAVVKIADEYSIDIKAAEALAENICQTYVDFYMPDYMQMVKDDYQFALDILDDYGFVNFL